MAANHVTFVVRGTHYHREAIEAIGIPNPEYKESPEKLFQTHKEGDAIDKYTFDITDVKLIPEPGNEHDPDAIAVIMNGQHVGYVAKESTDKVRKYSDSDRIKSMTGTMKGGPYKTLHISEAGKKYVTTDKGHYDAHVTLMLTATPKAQEAAAAGTGCLIPIIATVTAIGALISIIV